MLTACNAALTAIDTRGDIAWRVKWPGYRHNNVASLSLVEIGTGNVVFKKDVSKANKPSCKSDQIHKSPISNSKIPETLSFFCQAQFQ